MRLVRREREHDEVGVEAVDDREGGARDAQEHDVHLAFADGAQDGAQTSEVESEQQTESAAPPPKPTLADRMRPLVEQVASGAADTAQKAELERLLVAFWRSRLDLGSERAVDAIMTIRNHEEAGALLRQVEAWLHAPTPPATFDVADLLSPYRAVTADSLEVNSAAFGVAT